MDANKKYKIMNKPQGATKYINFGNITPGEKGPRMGIRNSPELREMLAATEDGKYLNFLIFSDDGQRGASSNAPPPKPADWDDNQEIPF